MDGHNQQPSLIDTYTRNFHNLSRSQILIIYENNTAKYDRNDPNFAFLPQYKYL